MSKNTRDRIKPAIVRTYGASPMAHSLAAHLADRIDTWEPRYPDETRENMIRETCWNWFSGGSTATIAARRVEEALKVEA
jgi:hypothetical protein